MGRNLSPVLCRELENLDKDAHSRKNAMKALKSYVKDLDSKAIPQFLAQVSATKDQGSCSGEYTISLYEVLARVHGRNIVPLIDNIVATILKTLSSSAGSFPLHQACSKVVPAIARYGIEPMTPQDEKTRVITSLCKPLAGVLMGPPESLASGAALCLKALVESDNWKFAPSDMVNELCLKVASALEERTTQTNAHMGLAMALSKHNSMTAEAYARSLLRSGLRILASGTEEGNSQKRFSAIQMINFLMRCMDSRSVSSELAHVAEIMESCQADPMPYIKGAAFEALQTARAISSRIGSRYQVPYIGSNFADSDYPLPGLVSPESQTVGSFVGHDSLSDSPLSTGQSSCNLGPGKRAGRRLWSDESSLEVSLKDGLFPGSASGSNGLRSYVQHLNGADRDDSDEAGECSGVFSGFVGSKVINGTIKRESTPKNPQRPRSPISIGDTTIFSTPRRLLRSLQDDDDESECHGDHFCGRPHRSPARPLRLELNPLTEAHAINSQSCNVANDAAKDRKEDGNGCCAPLIDCSESVSSSSDQPSECVAHVAASDGCVAGGSSGCAKGRWGKVAASLVMSMCLALPAIVVSFMLKDAGDDYYFDMVPT